MFRYPSGKFSKFAGRNRATYLACTMGRKTIIAGEVSGDWVDDDEEEEDDEDELVGVLVCGGEKEEGDLFEDFKGVLITNFWTPGGKSSLLSSKGFE